MSIFGAMFAGVSGLDAQAQALAIISDNIANMNTVGYKSTVARFATLVTVQAKEHSYASGGVRVSPTQLIDHQGLLESSSSATDMGIKGQGFFIVNTNADPSLGIDSYTRAGSFKTDLNGLLINTGGFYLQGWPTDSVGASAVMENPASLRAVDTTVAQNAAAATSAIAIGANLPASAPIGARFSVPTPIYDGLGVAHSVDVIYQKIGINEWSISTNPPAGSTQISFTDGGNTIASAGRIDFTALPAVGETLEIDGVVYTFIAGPTQFNNGGLIGGEIGVGVSLTQTIIDLVRAVDDPRIQKGTAAADLNSILFKQSLLPGITAESSFERGGTTPLVTIVQAGDPQTPTFEFGGANPDHDDETYAITVGGETFTLNPLIAHDPHFVAENMRNLINSRASPFMHATLAGNTLTVHMGSQMTFNTEGTLGTSQAGNGLVTVAALTPDGTIPGISFNGDGTPNAVKFTSIAAGWTNGASPTSISMTLGTTGGRGTAKADGLTQLSDKFSVSFTQQDGFPAGVLSGLTVNKDGLLTAVFDNGQTRPIFKIPLATFQNPNKLAALTGNIFRPTNASGNALLNTAGTGGAGLIFQSTLEASTVDIAEEFTRMIITQRAFSAASKVITTADEMLDELVRIKR